MFNDSLIRLVQWTEWETNLLPKAIVTCSVGDQLFSGFVRLTVIALINHILLDLVHNSKQAYRL